MPPSVSTKYFLGALRTTGTKSIEHEDWKSIIEIFKNVFAACKLKILIDFPSGQRRNDPTM